MYQIEYITNTYIGIFMHMLVEFLFSGKIYEVNGN